MCNVYFILQMTIITDCMYTVHKMQVNSVRKATYKLSFGKKVVNVSLALLSLSISLFIYICTVVRTTKFMVSSAYLHCNKESKSKPCTMNGV